VHLYLSAVTDAKIFEKTVKTEDGETITVMYSGLWKEENEACRIGEYQDVRPGQEGKPSKRDLAIMSTDAGSPFASFNPKLHPTTTVRRVEGQLSVEPSGGRGRQDGSCAESIESD
jgi:hypothetical protein